MTDNLEDPAVSEQCYDTSPHPQHTLWSDGKGNSNVCIGYPADDPVNHPKHYNSHPSGIECIDIVEHMTFNIGNAITYLWRYQEKGNPIQDLEKAAWYVNREIARLKG